MRFFGLFFLLSQHLIGSWWTSRNSEIFFQEFAEIFVHEFDFPLIIHGKSELSANYTKERLAFLGTIQGNAFPRYNQRKGMSFCELFYVKAGFTAVKSMEKVLTVCKFPAKSRAFLQDISRKVKTFHGSYCGKSCLYTESQNLTFWRPITTSKANFRQKFNHVWSVLPWIWKKKCKNM